jgi:hypothetical protein
MTMLRVAAVVTAAAAIAGAISFYDHLHQRPKFIVADDAIFIFKPNQGIKHHYDYQGRLQFWWFCGDYIREFECQTIQANI